MAEKDKAQYAPPASQVDLERRQESGNRSDAILSTADIYEPDEEGAPSSYAVEGNDLTQYVGTSQEYATYANETEAPLEADDSPEQKVFEQFASSPVPAVLRVEGNVELEGELASKEEAKAASKAAQSEDGKADASADTSGETRVAAKKTASSSSTSS